MLKPSSPERLLTSAEVARALAVAVSTVKRWTDDGSLASIRTLGGHRRYALEAVHDFANEHGYATSGLPPRTPAMNLPGSKGELAEKLLSLLGSGDRELSTALVLSAAQRVGLAQLLDEVVGESMRRVGDLWEEGTWGVDLEHRASYLIAEIIDRLRPPATPARAKQRALLTCTPGEQHDLPLRMVRVILEHHGWQTTYLGANMPWQSTAAAVTRTKPSLVLFSSREREPFEHDAFAALVKRWKSSRLEVGIGGWWVRGGSRETPDVHRFRTLAGFERWLKQR